MQALFIGHGYIDVTFVTDHIPTGDEKTIGKDYAFGIGGNSVVAAFTCAKFGLAPDLILPIADDWLGNMMLQMCARAGIRLHTRRVGRSSLSLVLPNNGKRAIVRCRDNAYTTPFPTDVALDGCKVLHLDGHQMDAALHYAKLCRARGVLTSLDGGTVRPGTEELLRFIDVAVVSENFCDVLGKSHDETLRYLAAQGVRVGAVTLGEKGLLMLEGGKTSSIPAISVPKEKVVDSTGAGDIFHGAYVYSYLRDATRPWVEHFAFARAASALSVQKLGAEGSIPSLTDTDTLARAHLLPPA
jgi:sulfofructose kinase